MELAKFKLSAFIWLVAIAFSFVALTPMLNLAQVHLMSTESSSAHRGESDTGGQAASPNPSNSGFDQEEKVRQLLAKEYEQRFGTRDEAIRSALGIRGKVADFVGYNVRQNRWLIAESKGGNIGDAFDQLSNTMRSVLAKHPDAQIELRIYVNAEKYESLSRGSDLGGYLINAEKHLGWANELKQWVDAEIEGVKILVLRAPS